MPAITFGGMASGLPPNIVETILDAERIPINTINARKAKTENKLKLVQDLESKVSGIRGSLGELASTRGFQDMKLISGDPNIIDGVVDPELSKAGSWNVEVVSLAQKAAALTNGFPDKDRTEIGIGYFKFDTPDGSKDVYIDGSSNTLEGAANAINRANLGVRASIIQDSEDPDNPYKLLLSGETVGNDSKINYPTLYFLDGDQDMYFDGAREAKNGIVKVDGFEIEIDSNKLEGLIPGVTLDLKQAAPGRQVNVTVKEDLELVVGKVEEFVKSMNEVLGFIQQQNAMDQNTDTTSTLGGDSLLRTVESRMRSLILTPQSGISGPIKRLNQIGIEFNRQGTLQFNKDKFNKTVASMPQEVSQLFAGDGFTKGVIPSVRRVVGDLLNSAFGPISNRKRGLEQKIRRADQRIESKERQLVRKEQNLRMKFGRLEETISRLKSQGAALGQLGGGGGLLSSLQASS